TPRYESPTESPPPAAPLPKESGESHRHWPSRSLLLPFGRYHHPAETGYCAAPPGQNSASPPPPPAPARDPARSCSLFCAHRLPLRRPLWQLHHAFWWQATPPLPQPCCRAIPYPWFFLHTGQSGRRVTPSPAGHTASSP